METTVEVMTKGILFKRVEPSPRSHLKARQSNLRDLRDLGKEAIEADGEGFLGGGSFGEPVRVERRKAAGSREVFGGDADVSGKIVKPKVRPIAKEFS